MKDTELKERVEFVAKHELNNNRCVLFPVRFTEVTQIMIPRMKNMTSQSCSRAYVTSLIRLATILGLCLNMGMHVQAQTAKRYTVGSGYINGSLWTNTLDGVVDATGLENAYKNWSSSVNVTVGDSLSMSLSSIFISFTFDPVHLNALDVSELACISPGCFYRMVQSSGCLQFYFLNSFQLRKRCTHSVHCEDLR